MRAEPGQLERALATITIGVEQDRVRKRRNLADTLTGEYDQQVQVEVTGSAGNDWGFADTYVQFQMPFLWAPTQREVPFDRPHFSKGFEIIGATQDLLHLDAQVINWDINETNWIVGATVRIYCIAPNVSAPLPYDAIAHLTFQGYCSNAEGDEFQ